MQDHRPIPASDTDFEATVVRFQELLEQNKYAKNNIVWLQPEDVLLPGKRFVYVRVPAPTTNYQNARDTYVSGLAHGRGVLISTICEMDKATACFVWFPKRPEEEPQGHWPRDGSVKLSLKIEQSRIPGRPVKNALLWALLRVRTRQRQKLKEFLFSG